MSLTFDLSSWRWADPDRASRGAKIAFHAAVFGIAFLILFSRRPDALLNAQFYAEDGTFWYADAYNYSWRCLFMSEAGYLHTVPRLVALFTLCFPLVYAPLIMNLSAFLAQILPIQLFLSSRFGGVPFSTRLLGCLLYLAVPNSFEIHANATNIQWHLALLGVMVLLARPPGGRAWRIFDLAVLALASVDSPLGLPLLAIAGLVWWVRRLNPAKWAIWCLIPGTALELLFVLLSQSRRAASNGATLTRLMSILGGQVFLSSILGVRTFIQFHYGHMRFLTLVEFVAAAIGLAMVAYALYHAPLELRLFVLFAAAVLAMALKHPLATMEAAPGQWELLRIPGFGNRYYFFPMLAFFTCLVWIIGYSPSGSRAPRYAALAVLLLLPVGVIRDWHYKPFVDFQFERYVAEFERAEPGTKVVIPTNPIWTTWTMELIKH
jgi:hypothetical protein